MPATGKIMVEASPTMKRSWRRLHLLALFCALVPSNWGISAVEKVKADNAVVCSVALLNWVETGKIPSSFARAIQVLVNEGPERWVVVEDSQTSGHFFQLGLSGGIGSSDGLSNKHLKAGAEYALPILFGEGNPKEGHISIMQSVRKAETYLEGVNREYAFPLVLNGSAAPFGFQEATEPSCDSSQVIPVMGLVPSNIHAMGFFFHNHNKKRNELNYYWASNYLILIKSLEEQGIVAGTESRGAQFLSELKIIWDQREWLYRPYKESFGLNELANKATMFSELERLFKKHRR